MAVQIGDSFQEVIKQFDRMCRYYQRKRECPMACPMNGVNISQCRKIAFEEPGVTEKTVMKWSAEHPEPVYPTWYEFMRENKIIPDVLEDCGDYYKTIGKWLVKATIKHDIAEKLGIGPKEG